jgi:alkylation response protein AidB-like acyl-CoA dehydrogenase
MELRLRDEQVALGDSFDALLEKAGTPERLRALGRAGFDPDLWATFCRMGAPGIAISESDGGDGAGLAEAAVICEQIGRHVAAVPFVDSCVAARLLAATGSPTVSDVLSGSLYATVALRPATDGEWKFVPSGSIAGLVIGLDGDQLVAVRTGADAEPLPNLADLPLCHRSTAGDRAVLATGADAIALHRRAMDEWRTLAAATLVGIAAGALDIGVAYTKERTQFGVPLATFQTIGHGLADLHTLVQGARILAQKAAWSSDTGDLKAPALAAMAFYFTAQTAETVAGKSLHYHGGYGFMLEYDVQLYYRRAKAWSLLHGDREQLLDGLAEQLFGESDATKTEA